MLSVKSIKNINRLLRFARNDDITCLLGIGEGLVGGNAANQPLPDKILKNTRHCERSEAISNYYRKT